MPRKTTKPAPPIVLTPEQIAEHEARKARNDAYIAACEALIEQALAFARKMSSRVFHSKGFTDDGFAVMFGDEDAPRLSFAGPGLVELRIEIRFNGRDDAGERLPPALHVYPRACSLSGSADLATCEALGQALIDAARFGHTLIALLA